MPLLEVIQIRILSNTADHAKKKSCPCRSLSSAHNLPKKVTPHRISQRAKERPSLEQAFLEETHHSLPSLPLLTLSAKLEKKK